MRALAQQSRSPGAPYRVALVLSDKPAAAGLEVARGLELCARALPAEEYATRGEYDRALAAALDEYAPSLIVLAGWLSGDCGQSIPLNR